MNVENPYQLTFEQVKRYLPHRYPFLLLDQVRAIHPVGNLADTTPEGKVGVKVEAIKSISGNEPFFQGHFPKHAVFPGVFQIEAMAQTACFSLYPYVQDHLDQFVKGFECALLGVDQVRFKKPVVPGDRLVLTSEVTRVRGKLWGFKCEAYVEEKKVSSAELLAMLGSSNQGSLS